MRTTARARVGTAGVVPPLILLLSACAGDVSLPTAPSMESRVDVDTPTLRQLKSDADVEKCPEPTGVGSDLPELSLPCLGGGRELTLSEIGGPAVLSVWASWCGPCEKEMPYFARLHRDTGDELTMLGVNYEDPAPDAALALLDQKQATFPQVADPGGSVADHYRVRGVPGILFVDAEGTVTWRNIQVHSYDELSGLVRDLAGVDVADL